jgi:ABC-type bacteriocin/lantibiotic exporter with double-glycine peptidase domain
MKSLKVPYFKQETHYTCGPATMQMILKYYGIERTEADLASELATNSDIGTLHEHMIEGVLRHGLHCYVNDQATVQELRYLLDFKVPVIIRFIEPKGNEDHYGVVVGVNRFFVTIHDPWSGAYQRYSHKHFKERWQCPAIGTCAQWLMAVSKLPLPIGQQHHPRHG